MGAMGEETTAGSARLNEAAIAQDLHERAIPQLQDAIAAKRSEVEERQTEIEELGTELERLQDARSKMVSAGVSSDPEQLPDPPVRRPGGRPRRP